MTLSADQQALLAVRKLRAKLDAVERARTEPIAVVGVGCRFPGGAAGPDGYWRLLAEGRDAVGEIPPDRWDVDAYYDTDRGAPGKIYCRAGAFLDRIDGFDAELFGIAPKEVRRMDPQQRLFLEVVWEAIEHASIAPDSLVGSRTGVFTGISTTDYMHLHTTRLGPAGMDAYVLSGNMLHPAAGRISYLLGLQGPAMAIDTACSSSLVAIDRACRSLRDRESDLAVAGGVSLMVAPETYIGFCRWGMVAPDGRCKTFDARADGFGRGEGSGAVVLKRLSDARADGDRILAVIRGSAVNQDGASSGLSVPNGLAQQAVIRAALANAGVAPADVGYVEAHGTGTELGDPLEVEALAAVLGEGRPADRPLLIGSVKTNFGHLEAAAGVAGLIKTVLSLYHGRIPAHLHFETPTPRIAWDRIPVRVAGTSIPWARGDRPRLAGVSGFGFSGTNVHLVLEEAPEDTSATAGDDRESVHINAADRPLHVLPLSARTEPALRALAARYRDRLAEPSPGRAADIAHSAGTGRAKLEHRLAVIGASTGEFRARLDDHLAGCSAAGLVTGAPGETPRVAFLFPGHAEGLAGTGRELYETSPVFRAAIDRCADAVRDVLGVALTDVMGLSGGAPAGAARDGDLLDRPEYAEPALFALGWALAELWRSWGVAPAAVSGFGAGEYVAAVVAGVMEPEAGIRLAAERARAAGATRGSAADPSGFQNALAEAELRPPAMRLVSSVTGQDATAEHLADPAYWSRQAATQPRIEAALETLVGHGANVFLEVGPSPFLRRAEREKQPAGRALWLPSLRAGHGEWNRILESLAALFVRGVYVDWAGFDRPYGRAKVPLPTYAFQHERFWIEAPAPQPPTRSHSGRDTAHPLLGARLRTATESRVFEAALSAERPSWIADHRVQDAPVLPATAYMEMALAAARAAPEALHGESPPAGAVVVALEDLTLREPLVFSGGDERVIQLVLSPEGAGSAAFRILALDDADEDDVEDRWRLHATGTLRVEAAASPLGADAPPFDSGNPTGAYASPDGLYAGLAERGLEYRGAFRGVTALLADGETATARIELPAEGRADADAFGFHPAFLDACLQAVGAVLPESTTGSYLPIAVDRLRVAGAVPISGWCQARLRATEHDGKTLVADVLVRDDDGEPVLEASGIRLRRVRPRPRQTTPDTIRKWFHRVEWIERPRPQETEAGAGAAGRWLVVGDADGLGAALAERLRSNGQPCTLAVPASTAELAGAATIALDTTRPDELRSAVDAAFGAGGPPPIGVVYLSALDMEPPTHGHSAEEAERLADVQRRVTGGALHLAQAIVAAGHSPRVWIVTRGAQAVHGHDATDPHQSTLWGLARVLADEHPELACVTLDLDPDSPPDVDRLLAEIRGADAEDQIALRGDIRWAARLVRWTPPQDEPVERPYELHSPSPGVLDSLMLRPAESREPGPDEVRIEVRATGLNFRDVLNALGEYPGGPVPLGGECAGVVTAIGPNVTGLAPGDAVVALVPGAFASHIVARAEWVAAKPPSLGFPEAATVPSAYATAWHALHHLAGIGPGDHVLIHAAAGGVGMAAVRLAQRAGAEVMATAGSPAKRALLQSLGVRHVMDSRTLDFADEVLRVTGGRGADVVLNSLAGDFMARSFDALADEGRFIEIGRRGLWTPDQVAEIRPNAAYHTVDLAAAAAAEPAFMRKLLDEVMAAVAAGELGPLPYRAFPLSDVVDAFRHMAHARHTGKIVVVHPPPSAADGVRADASYLVTGGLGGLGLQVARWLVDRGARHLALVSRGAPGDDAAAAVAGLERDGASVRVLAGDVSSVEDVDRILATIDTEMPPLRGVVHAAGVLDEATIAQQDWERFARVFGPKVDGGWNLHTRTRTLPLDFFVLFSSGVSLVGAGGLSNHAAACAFLDALAHHRRALGLPGLSIDWGQWSEVGAAAERQVAERLAGRGIGAMSPVQGIAAFSWIMAAPEAASQVAVLPVQWNRFFDGQSPRAFFSALARTVKDQERRPEPLPTDPQQPGQPERAPGPDDLRRRLDEASPARRRSLLGAYVRAQAIRALGLRRDTTLNPGQPLHELGLDSLMAVELRNLLGQGLRLDRPLPATLVFDHPTVDALTGYLERAIFEAAPAASPATGESDASAGPVRGAGSGATGQDDDVDDLSDTEAEALLLKELESMRGSQD